MSRESDVELVYVATWGDKVVIAGNFSHIDGVLRRGIARLNSDGSLDRSFDARQNEGLRSASLGKDGSIVLPHVVFTPRGTINTKYDIRNYLNSNARMSFDILDVQKDGKVLIKTYKDLLRLNINGSIDRSFARHGDITGLTGATQLRNGKILLNGWFNEISGQKRYAFARLSESGDLE